MDRSYVFFSLNHRKILICISYTYFRDLSIVFVDLSIVLPNPSRIYSANGAPQFAQRSTKSHTGMPTIGRMNAVANPQNVAHISTHFIGLISMLIPMAISKMPMAKTIVPAKSGVTPKSCTSQPTILLFPDEIRNFCIIPSKH